jgi:hypothetical protein
MFISKLTLYKANAIVITFLLYACFHAARTSWSASKPYILKEYFIINIKDILFKTIKNLF